VQCYQDLLNETQKFLSTLVLTCGVILLHSIKPPQWLRVRKQRVLVGIEILWKALCEWKQVLCSATYDLMLRIKITLSPLLTSRLRSKLISYVILRLLFACMNEWMNDDDDCSYHSRPRVLWWAVSFWLFWWAHECLASAFAGLSKEWVNSFVNEILSMTTMRFWLKIF
jgi:hypothetical protein